MARSIWTDSSGALGSYTTGGITVPTTLTSVDFATVEVDTTNAALSVPLFFQISRSGANFTYKIMVFSYDKLTAIGNITGLPAGVTAATTSGQSYVADTAHTHATDHDHGAFTSGNAVSGAGGVAIDAVGSKDVLGHNHTIDIPAFTGTSGVGGSHTHTSSNLYQHQHSLTNTSTDGTLVELANGTGFGATRFIYMAVST